jgi:hypothetical protein
MKRVFLLIAVPVLLVALGFAQTPAASGNADQVNTDQMNIKGCLGGSDGNYTVAEDDTGKIFKISTSSTDLKAYSGQHVTLIGHKADTTENSLAVTGVNMISEHCNAAAAAPAATASAPAETTSTVPVDAAPAAVAPAAAVSAPAETISTPPADATPAAAAPVAVVSAPAETASAPPAAAPVHRAGPSARPPKSSPTPAAAAIPAEPVSTPVAHEVAPVAPDATSRDTASTTAAPVAAAPKTSGIKSAGMIVTIVVVLLFGAGVPLYSRWRRRKLAEQTKGENLSFTKEAKSDPGKTDTTGGRKAA